MWYRSLSRSTTDAIIYMYMYILGLLRFVIAIGLLRRSRLKIYAHSSSLTDVENVIEVLGNIKAAICGTCRH